VGLRRKPHAVTVDLPEAVIQDDVLNGYGDSPQGTVEGMLYPVDSGTMFERFGVETKRGSAFLCDPEHAPKFVEGGRVSHGGRKYAVKGEPLVYQGFGAADNATVPLEEVD